VAFKTETPPVVTVRLSNLIKRQIMTIITYLEYCNYLIGSMSQWRRSRFDFVTPLGFYIKRKSNQSKTTKVCSSLQLTPSWLMWKITMSVKNNFSKTLLFIFKQSDLLKSSGGHY